MTVREKLEIIEAESGYVINSLILKSYDDYGGTWKWLQKSVQGFGYRREIFLAFEGSGDIMDKTILDEIEILPAR